MMLAWAGVDHIQDEEDWVSSLYGKRERAPVIRAFMEAHPSPDAVTLLLPHSRRPAPTRFTARRSGEGWIVEVTTESGTWTIQFGPGLATDGALTAGAAVAFLHQPTGPTATVRQGVIGSSDCGGTPGGSLPIQETWVLQVDERGRLSRRDIALMHPARGA